MRWRPLAAGLSGRYAGPMRSRRRVGPLAGYQLPRGFTLTEMLVVIAIIVLLISIVFVVARWSMVSARGVACLQNERSITAAFFSYATDNAGRFAGTDTGVHKHDWDQATNYLNSQGYETEKGITTGSLWPYLLDKRVYKSPFDPFTLTQRIRSYSISGFLSDSIGWQWAGPPNKLVSGLARIKRPSDTLAVVVEYDHRGYNINSWGVMGNTSYIWVDKLCNWNPRHFNFSFADGHVEPFKYVSPKEDVDYYFTLPANSIYFETPDYDWVVMHLYPGLDW